MSCNGSSAGRSDVEFSKMDPRLREDDPITDRSDGSPPPRDKSTQDQLSWNTQPSSIYEIVAEAASASNWGNAASK